MERKDFLAQTEMQILLEPINPGESQLKEYLRAHGYKVIDVSNNPDYFKKDIDLFAMDQNGAITSIEVKWDSVISRTGNLFIETCSNVSKKKEGWFQFCQADYLYYGDAANEKFYIIKMEELREYFNENKDNLKKRRATEKNNSKVSEGYIIPISNIDFATELHLRG